MTENKITITRRNSGFQNVPPDYFIGSVDAQDRGEDEASVGHLYHKPVEYALPAGYTLDTDYAEDPFIKGPDGRACRVVDGGDSRRGWTGPTIDGHIVLRRVE